MRFDSLLDSVGGTPLVGLPRLNFVKLYGTRVPRKAALDYETKAGVRIDHRNGAFLGVSGKGVEGICLISNIQPASPAEKSPFGGPGESSAGAARSSAPGGPDTAGRPVAVAAVRARAASASAAA